MKNIDIKSKSITVNPGLTAASLIQNSRLLAQRLIEGGDYSKSNIFDMKFDEKRRLPRIVDKELKKKDSNHSELNNIVDSERRYPNI